MASIVYDSLLRGVVAGNINLALPNTYKVALLKGYPGGRTPSSSDDYTYGTLHDSGYESQDTSGSATSGYKQGGKFVSLMKSAASTDGRVEYTCSDIEWDNVTLDSDNGARYAVIYRKSDGLLVSCYGFDETVYVDNDTLRLSWYGTPVIIFGTQQGGQFIIDSDFSKSSANALQNKVVTKGLVDYGVVLDGDEPVEGGPLSGMDRLSKITEGQIDGLFTNTEDADA